MAQFPGKWTVRNEQAFGFEISRALGGHESEWLKDENGVELTFDHKEDAQAACDRANEQ